MQIREDNAIAWYRRLSLRLELAGGFTAVIALTLVVGVVALVAQNHSTEAINKLVAVDSRIADLSLRSNIAMLRARRAEKDFLIFQREFGFDEARSRYSTLLRTGLVEVRQGMADVRELSSEPQVIQLTQSIDTAVDRYEAGFLRLVSLYGLRGYVKTGFEGKFREKAHEIEAIVSTENHARLMVDLLSLRRHEKDFVARGIDKYVEAFAKGIDQFKADLALAPLSPEVKGKLLGLTADYARWFEQYVEAGAKIDTEQAAYLTAAHTVEPLFDKLRATAELNVYATRDNAERGAQTARWAILATALLASLLGLAVALIISRSITKSVDECLGFASRVAGGDLTTRLLPKGKSEFGTLAIALNRMTEVLQEREAELEDKVIARTADLERARRVAEEANEAKSSFLAAMSHEIRTPMNGVVGMIDVLHQSSLKGDQVEMVKLIRESAFSLLAIIEDILDFSKIEAGKLQLDREPIAIAEVMDAVCSLLNGLAEKNDIVLTQYSDPDIPQQVLGDALRLRQVLINIANNAIKFSSGQLHAGRVSVRALRVEQDAEEVMVEFKVTDNGIGMDEATQARLFSAFTQADVSTTRRFGGTGLGLAIANNLVKLMDGEIAVHSAPSAGAVFTVRLPFVRMPAGSTAIEAPSEVAGLSCVVVGAAGGLADDLAVYLEHANAVVERAPDLASAKGRSAGRSGLSVCVVDACDEPQYPEQLRAIRDQNDPEARLVVVLIERGKRRHPRAVSPGLIIVDGNALNRRTFLKAVAAAAGRVSLETQAEELPPGRIAVIAQTRTEALRQGRLILIVEDNETNQKVIVRQLALLGYAADVAGDGCEALERWKSGDYALLLTDLHMPKLDGYELTQAIRAAEKGGKRIPIIALTANALKGEAEHCRTIGMDDYRSKPVPLAALEAVLAKWLPVAKSGANASTLSAWPVPAATQAAAAPVDVNVLKALVGDDPEFVREFLQDFRRKAIETQGELRAACASGDAKAAATAAHNLKSLARTIGAFALGDLCEAMETAGKADDNDALKLLLPRFESEQAAVEHYLDGP